MRFMHDFQTVLGRNLVGELRNFVHRPFLLVTMEDMWPKFNAAFEGAECSVYFVRSVEEKALLADLAQFPDAQAVVGLGGGMAIDTAKYFSWKRRLPLFQVLTALSMDAAFGHRAGIRIDGVVHYIGWAMPEAVYIDYDVIKAAPPHLNYSGIGDILCNHTGVLDWRYATRIGKCEAKWPYDEEAAAASLRKVDNVLSHVDDIRRLTDKGIEVLIDGLRWGTSFHGNGWNPRHVEGTEHFFFYTLEYETRKKFVHGQPVGLGVYVACLLHDSRAEEMLSAMRRIGLDIRPEAMGVGWDEVGSALHHMRDFVHRNRLWYSIAHDAEVDAKFVDRVRAGVEGAYGAWRSDREPDHVTLSGAS
ncbi:MAG: iron-containing alcohol dehydrogenase family protein [Alphaproteobacteria bacterium]|nr:iron-containing alcohol dehydrogenase family protein [Alphaproteobacteria bacterium]